MHQRRDGEKNVQGPCCGAAPAEFEERPGGGWVLSDPVWVFFRRTSTEFTFGPEEPEPEPEPASFLQQLTRQKRL